MCSNNATTVTTKYNQTNITAAAYCYTNTTPTLALLIKQAVIQFMHWSNITFKLTCAECFSNHRVWQQAKKHIRFILQYILTFQCFSCWKSRVIIHSTFGSQTVALCFCTQHSWRHQTSNSGQAVILYTFYGNCKWVQLVCWKACLWR